MFLQACCNDEKDSHEDNPPASLCQALALCPALRILSHCTLMVTAMDTIAAPNLQRRKLKHSKGKLQAQD